MCGQKISNTVLAVSWADAIRALIATLDERGNHLVAVDPGLVQDVTAYVLDGTDPGVLQRLGTTGVAQLGMSVHDTEDGHPARELYDAFTTVPAEVLIRWALALHADGGHWTNRLQVDGVSWPGALLAHLGLAYPHGELPFDFFRFARLLSDGEVHPGRLVVEAWAMGKDTYWRRSRGELTLARLRGYGAAVEQLHQWLAPLLVGGDLDHRLHAFEMLAPVPDDVLARFAEQVAASATSGSAQVRAAAAALVDRVPATVAGHLRTLAVEGKPEQRRRALQLLWDTASDDEQRGFARDTALADRAASVRTVGDGFAATARDDAVPLPAVPEPEPVDWALEWTPDLASLVTAYVPELRWWRPVDRAGGGDRDCAHDEVVETLREQLTKAGPVTEPCFARQYGFARSTAIREGIERGLLTTAGVVKLLVIGNHLEDDYAGFSDLRWSAQLLHAHAGLTLLDLAAHLQDVPGLDPVDIIARAWFHDEDGLARTWTPDAVWPFVARHLDGVLAYWQQRRTGHSYGFESEALFPLVASFPQPPTRLVELCYDLALGAGKSDQRAAQDHLRTHRDAVPRATAALADGNGTIRAVAAEWLGRLRDRAAVPALAAALKTERNETVQGSMLDALVALGEPLETHVDLASVDVQAAKAMAKGLPAALRWLDPDSLPGVRRAGSATAVPRATLLWLTARAVAAKSPTPTSLLRACVAQLDPGDAEAFADRLLALWVAADEGSVGRTGWRAGLGGHQERGPSPGAAAKGLLAVVASCGGPESVRVATRYVRTWHGQRAAQSKALVTMLAHHRDPGAAAALVAIAYRFKAPSIERAAREEVAGLADRLGWTTDELADRTVSTAGFDEEGTLELSYGPRCFTARLLADCGIVLLDADGNAVKGLPTPRQSDDAELAKEARTTLSAAKKQLTDTVAAQTTRLHDAMCSQRAWTGAAWQQDLAGHPVLARLVAQLVWLARSGDRRFTFRLLDDGTLTDVDDEPVELPDDADVRIAHDATLTDEEVAGWQRHLADYEVPTLFWQLGRGRVDLTAEQSAATRFESGARVPVGRLGQVTARLGYRRGVVGDSAAYDWLEKEFPTLGLTARITLEGGQYVGDHESETTVTGLEVVAGATGRPLPLGDLPPVLLVEVRHDLAVASGTQGPQEEMS
jgi:hypothetical protein